METMNHDTLARKNWEPTLAKCAYCRKVHSTIRLCPKIAKDRLREALALPFYLSDYSNSYLFNLKKQSKFAKDL
jgi:hypothetical protein